MDQHGRQQNAQHAQAAHQHHDGRSDQVRQQRGVLLPLGGEVVGEGRDKRGRKRAFGEQIAGEVGDAEPEQKGVGGLARAKQAGHDDFAHKPAQPAQQNRPGDHAGRAHNALVPGRPVHDVFADSFVNSGQTAPGNAPPS